MADRRVEWLGDYVYSVVCLFCVGGTIGRQESGMAGLAGGLTEGLVVRDGNFLEAVAEVGLFEHCLTTDLLNHLVFVQKIFMKVLYIL